MTFIDTSQGKPPPSLVAGYSLLCAVSLLCAYWAVHVGLSRQHYRSFFSVRVLFPLALVILALENVALATSGFIYDDLAADGGQANYDALVFYKAVFVLQTFEVPILLIVFFEITYLVHKRRSVRFCLMYFDEGARVDSTAYTSFVLRNSVRALSTVLAVLGLVVNFNLIETDTEVDRLSGRTGWWALSRDDLTTEQRLFLLSSLIPTAILIFVAFYLSIMLWRYGTSRSMVLHSSMCNPWFYSFFGTLAMMIGQVFTANLYAFMSNLGVLVFIITILLLMAEVDKDMVAANDVACFLAAVAQKGDEIHIIDTVNPTPKHPQPHEEEKQPEDEEMGGARRTGRPTTLVDNGTKGKAEDITSSDQSLELTCLVDDGGKALGGIETASSVSKHPPPRDPAPCEEEKRPEDEDTGSAVFTDSSTRESTTVTKNMAVVADPTDQNQAPDSCRVERHPTDRPAILVENETKDNAVDTNSLDQNLELACNVEDGDKAVGGIETASPVSELQLLDPPPFKEEKQLEKWLEDEETGSAVSTGSSAGGSAAVTAKVIAAANPAE